MPPNTKMILPTQGRFPRGASPVPSTDSDEMRKQTLERISKSFENLSTTSEGSMGNRQVLLTDLKPTLMHVLSNQSLEVQSDKMRKAEEVYDELELKSFTTSTQSSSSSDDIPSPRLFSQSKSPKTSIISLDESESEASEDSELANIYPLTSKLEEYIMPRSTTLSNRKPIREDDRSQDSDITPITNPRLVMKYEEAKPKVVTTKNQPVKPVQMPKKLAAPEEKTFTGFHQLCTMATGEDDPKWDILFVVFRSRASDEMINVVEAKQHGVTPLYLICQQKPPTRIVQSLISIAPGTVHDADENGFLPLHVACACDANDDVIRLLVEADVTTKESLTVSGKTPLHLWMYKHKCSLPSIELFKVLVSPYVMEQIDKHGNSPLSLYHDFIKQIRGSGVYDKYVQKEFSKELFDAYMDTKPLGKIALIREISRFPSWLQDHALTHDNLRRILNFRITQRSLSFIIFFDLIIQIMLIVTFMSAMNKFIFREDDRQVTNTVFLSIGISYTILRSLFHFISFNLIAFLFNLWNLLDITQIVFLILSVDSLNRNASISSYDSIVWTTTGGLLWVRAVSMLRTTFLPFSIFISGFIRVSFYDKLG